MKCANSIMALVAVRGFRRSLGTGKSLSFVRLRTISGGVIKNIGHVSGSHGGDQMAVKDDIKVSSFFRVCGFVLVGIGSIALFRVYQQGFQPSWTAWLWFAITPIFTVWLYLFGYMAVAGHWPSWMAVTKSNKQSSESKTPFERVLHSEDKGTEYGILIKIVFGLIWVICSVGFFVLCGWWHWAWLGVIILVFASIVFG